MNSFSRYVLILLLLATSIGYSQTKGLIYKPAGSALGKSILDPNGDGYTSLTTAGFSGTDYGAASELNMVPLPIIGAEPTGDLTTGGSGGATDIVSVGENSNQSCYVLYKTVGGVPYLIVRFRLGGASTAAKGYSFLIDVDGTFGSQYTDPKNPGYEREVVLNTGNSSAIVVNTFSGPTGGVTGTPVTFSNENYTQRSIALTTVGGDADYFYDFFIPYSALGLTTEPVRIAAATINSAGSGITGTKSDYNGVNDSLYGNNSTAIAKALISAFPATSLTSLTSGTSFANPITLSPVVNGGITASSTSISGTSTEINGTVITIYKNGISIGTATVTSNSWTLTGVSGLVAGDTITAQAQATGKDLSLVSDSITVTGVQTCYTQAPTSLTRPGSQAITGLYAHANGTTVVANTVRIRLYEQINTGTVVSFSEISSASLIYVLANGTWSFPTGLTTPVFNLTTIVATATYSSCVSTYSTVSKKSSGQVGIITATPTMVTTQIIASPTISRSVQVTNNDTTASNLILYVNGIQVAVSPTTVAPNATYTFSYTGFIEGDIVTARAQSTTIDYWISDPTANLVVIASATVTSTPVISGTYIAGTGKTVTGTSTESAGTVIYLYKGSTLLGSTTVDAFGNWSISSLTLTAGDVLTATSKATGETISPSSTSITVAASAPTAPTVTGPSYQAGATSITGTGGLGTGITLTVYVDGSPIGTIPNAPASWTLSGIASGQLYKGAVITATNTNLSTGVESILSNSVPVIGVASFCITDIDGNSITDKQSGETFDIKITAMDGPNCTGSVFTGFTGTVVLSSSTSMLLGGGTTAVFVNGVLASHSVALGTPGTAITLSAINSDDPSTKGTATLNVTASVWTGTTSTAFNTGSNWSSNLVPVSGADISIPAVANAPVLTTSATVGNLNIASGTTLGLGGQTLTVSGGFANTGTLIGGGDSSLVVNGAGSSGTLYMNQTIAGTSNILKDFTLNKDVLASSVTIGNELNLIGILSLTRGTLNTGGFLVLKSSATTTAVVGQILDCNGVAISGEVTVEKFIPARRAYRLITSPVTTTTFIRDNWQEGANNTVTAYSGNQNPKHGYGTHITGVLANSPGFDLTQTTNNSMFAYNNATAAWVAVANTNATTLTAGVPYRLMVRGDRSIDLNTNTPIPTNTILRSKGTLKICDAPSVILSAASEGTSFVGNPYQAVVDIKAALNAGTNLNTGFYWVWDPMLNARGGYVTYDLNANSPSVLTSLVNQYLQPGQACFVKNSLAGNGAVTFKENHKAITPVNGAISRVGASKASYIKLNLYESSALASQAAAADGLIVKFGADFTNDVDATDANKFTNLDENFATNNNGKLLSIESRAMPQSTDEIPLHINQYRKVNYSIVAEAKNIEGVIPFLFDKFNQIYTEIPLDGAAKYNYSITSSDALSTSSTRFDIVFKTKSTLGTEINEFKQGIQLYPNPVNEGWFLLSSSTGSKDLEIEIFNVLGQKINFSTSNLEANTIKVDMSKAIKKGVYWVNIKQNGQEVTHKIIIN